MTLKRLLIAIAALCELAAAVGYGVLDFGSVSLSLLAAGLFFYFLAEFA